MSRPASPVVPSGFSEHVVRLDGARVHYLRGGAGMPLVLLHGWPQTWFEWRLVMPELAGRFDVIVPSLRGVCGSASDDGRYDAPAMAGDLRALLAELGVERAHIVGHDIGMLVAYAFARLYPDVTERLVIMEGIVLGIEPMTTDFSRFPRAWNFGFNMTPELPEALTRDRERVFFDFFFDYIAARPERLTEEARAEYVRAYRAPGAMSAGFGWYRAFPQDIAFNLEGPKQKLAMPVLALGGAQCMGDIMRPMLEQVADDVRGHTFADCGHYVPEEAPDELAGVLAEFLAGKPRSLTGADAIAEPGPG